jgi:hypothetical protein
MSSISDNLYVAIILGIGAACFLAALILSAREGKKLKNPITLDKGTLFFVLTFLALRVAQVEVKGPQALFGALIAAVFVGWFMSVPVQLVMVTAEARSDRGERTIWYPPSYSPQVRQPGWALPGNLAWYLRGVALPVALSFAIVLIGIFGFRMTPFYASLAVLIGLLIAPVIARYQLAHPKQDGSVQPQARTP